MLIYIKGAGDLASGIALKLHHAKFNIVMTDLPVPTAVRRTVAFSEAIRLGSTTVEDVKSERAESVEQVRDCISRDIIPVVPVPADDIIDRLHPEVIIDAVIAKRNLGTRIEDAPLVIGVGPGFTAGEDCHAVIETKRGHTLGRVIWKGAAIPNTGIPGEIGGETVNRVFRAPTEGIFHPQRDFGDIVYKGDIVANVDGIPVFTAISGIIRGMLQDGVHVTRGFKCGDVDPRGPSVDYMTVSDKAMAIAGGALEVVAAFAAEKR